MGYIGAYEGHCGSLQRYGWYFGVTLGSLWGHSGATWGYLGDPPDRSHLRVLWRHFGVTLGHCQGTWGHFSLTRMTLDYFGIAFEQLLVYESPFSQRLHSLMDFNDFMKHWDRIGVTWSHVGVTFKVT